MNKLTCIVLTLALAAGCRDKQPAKQTPTAGSGSAQPADPRWVERLPAVSGGDPQIMLQYTSGLVRIDADGTVHVANAPAAADADPRSPANPFGAARPVQVAGLAEALNLPPLVKRTESAFGPIESAGSGSAAGSAEGNPADLAFALLGHPVPASGSPLPPERMTSAFALVHPDDVSGGIVVFADGQAPAGLLVDVLAQTGGFLAVRRDGKLGALPLALDRHEPAPVAPNRSWLEVRVDKAIELESVPSKPTQVASVDKLAEAVTAAKARAVDVLVGPTAKVADLIAAVDQLRIAKVEAIGFGRAPQTPGAVATRGEQGPHVVAWDFFMHDIDTTATPPFRTALDNTLSAMRTCYATLVAKAPDLAGVAQLELFVAANAKVAAAEAKGVAPELAACVVDTVKAGTFPRPSSAGAKLVAKLAFQPR